MDITAQFCAAQVFMIIFSATPNREDYVGIFYPWPLRSYNQDQQRLFAQQDSASKQTLFRH